MSECGAQNFEKRFEGSYTLYNLSLPFETWAWDSVLMIQNYGAADSRFKEIQGLYTFRNVHKILNFLKFKLLISFYHFSIDLKLSKVY